jgi:hypothetical protein
MAASALVAGWVAAKKAENRGGFRGDSPRYGAVGRGGLGCVLLCPAPGSPWLP